MITDINFGPDGKLYGKLLGEMDIVGKDYDDLLVAAREALECFFILCKKHGKSVEEELMSMLDF